MKTHRDILKRFVGGGEFKEPKMAQDNVRSQIDVQGNIDRKSFFETQREIFEKKKAYDTWRQGKDLDVDYKEDFGNIDYPRTSLLRGDNIAPNTAWMYPNLKGKTQASVTQLANEDLAFEVLTAGMVGQGLKGSKTIDKLSKFVGKADDVKPIVSSVDDIGKASINNLSDLTSGHLIKASQGSKSTIREILGELKQGKDNRKAIKKGNEWLDNWIKHPSTQNKIDATIDNKKDFAISFSKNPKETEELFELIRTQSKAFKPDSKEYSLLRQLDDNLTQYLFKENRGHIHANNIGVSYKHSQNPSFRKNVDEGIFPKSVIDKRYGSWISRNSKIPQKYRTSTAIHEGTHDWVSEEAFEKLGIRDITLKNTSPELKKDFLEWENYRKFNIDPSEKMGGKRAYEAYLADPTEVHARIMELRKGLDLTPNEYVSPEFAEKIIDFVNSGNSTIDPTFLKVFDYNPKKLSELFNKLWSIPAAGAVVTAGALSQEEFKEGGEVLRKFIEGGENMEQQNQEQQILQAVAEMLEQGISPEEIYQELVNQGIPEQDAEMIIQSVMEQTQTREGSLEEYADGRTVTEHNRIDNLPYGDFSEARESWRNVAKDFSFDNNTGTFSTPLKGVGKALKDTFTDGNINTAMRGVNQAGDPRSMMWALPDKGLGSGLKKWAGLAAGLSGSYLGYRNLFNKKETDIAGKPDTPKSIGYEPDLDKSFRNLLTQNGHGAGIAGRPKVGSLPSFNQELNIPNLPFSNNSQLNKFIQSQDFSKLDEFEKNQMNEHINNWENLKGQNKIGPVSDGYYKKGGTLKKYIYGGPPSQEETHFHRSPSESYGSGMYQGNMVKDNFNFNIPTSQNSDIPARMPSGINSVNMNIDNELVLPDKLRDNESQLKQQEKLKRFVTRRGDASNFVAATNAISGFGMANDVMEAEDFQKQYDRMLTRTGNTMNKYNPKSPLNPFGTYTTNVGVGPNYNLTNAGHTQDFGTRMKKGGNVKKYQEGGQYQLSEEEIQELINQGYDVEILD